MSLQYLNQVEIEGLSRLVKQGVAFVVVGSHALLHYTSPTRPDRTLRTIGDLDLFIECSAENFDKLLMALSGPAWSCPPEIITGTLRLGRSFNIAPYRIQFISTLDGVDWASVSGTAQQILSAAGTVSVISRELLITNKKAVGRPKDLEDVRGLEATMAINAA